ncbi:MAG TPA: hypothetical protein VK428_04465, partial [Acidimicrobiales bacterium]|nr:hypothetical protein [Acidimicrobiales bacterium]
PWPVYGAAGFVWGAGLVAVAIGYALKSRNQLPPGGLKWGLVLAVLGWFVPLILNQLVNWSTLHKFHKLLAFISAFIVLVVWITALKDQTRRISSED